MLITVSQSPKQKIASVGIQGPQGIPGISVLNNIAAPASLIIGTMAYSELSDNLFIGLSDGVTKIAGASDVVKLAASTHLATPGTLAQRDNAGSIKFNIAEVNGLTLNGNITSTSTITSICTSTTNQTINIGATTASTVVTSAIRVKSSLTDVLKVLDQNDLTIFNIAQNGNATLKNFTATGGTVNGSLSVTGNITSADINSDTGTISTLTSTSAGITTLTVGSVTCSGTLSAGATTVTSLTVNGTSLLKGNVSGLTALNAKSNLTNFVIAGNDNTLKIRTTIDNLTSLVAGSGELYLSGGKLYYRESDGSIRTFISSDSDANMSIGNIILEGVLKIDTSTSTGGLANQEHVIDSFPINTYRSAKYFVQISSGSNYQSSEVLVVHNGTESYLTEYGFVQTNGTLANVETRIEGGLVKLVAVGNYNALTYQVVRQAIAI